MIKILTDITETLSEHTDVLSDFVLPLIILILFLGVIVSLFFYCIRIEFVTRDKRKKFFKELDEHQKSAILEYQHIGCDVKEIFTYRKDVN